MRIRLRYYHKLRQEAQRSEEVLEFGDDDAPASIDQLVSILIARWPGLISYKSSILYARNGEFASAETPISDGDTIDLMPPFCGG